MIRIGTRKSQLALWQANWCVDQLRVQGVDAEIIEIVTKGDVTKGSLAAVGGQGLFTKAIQQALLANEVDLAVHSLKDLPTQPSEGLELVAVPLREEPRDVLVARDELNFDDLPPRAIVGTGSIRRQAQILNARPDLIVKDIRGNVETRIGKMDDGEYDAIVLAFAGMHRLKLDERITQIFPDQIMLPAVGQGALGLEARADDNATREAAVLLNDLASWFRVTAERALLRTLKAGCLAPVGCLAQVDDNSNELTLQSVVLDPKGETRLDATHSGLMAEAESIGIQAAEDLLNQGAGPLIESSH